MPISLNDLFTHLLVPADGPRSLAKVMGWFPDDQLSPRSVRRLYELRDYPRWPDSNTLIECSSIEPSEPSSGAWDVRLHGVMSPCSILEVTDGWKLLYIGADGNRRTDGGPRHRCLGGASSVDGRTFRKWDQKILQHPRGGSLKDEEGIHSAGLYAVGHDLHLVYSGLTGIDEELVKVQGFVAVAPGGDLTAIGPPTLIMEAHMPGLYGAHKEMFPTGGLALDDKFYVVYLTKIFGPNQSFLGIDLAVARYSDSYSLEGSWLLVPSRRSGDHINSATDVVQFSAGRIGLVLGRGSWEGASTRYEAYSLSVADLANADNTAPTATLDATWAADPDRRDVAIGFAQGASAWHLLQLQLTGPQQARIHVRSDLPPLL